MQSCIITVDIQFHFYTIGTVLIRIPVCTEYYLVSNKVLIIVFTSSSIKFSHSNFGLTTPQACHCHPARVLPHPRLNHCHLCLPTWPLPQSCLRADPPCSSAPVLASSTSNGGRRRVRLRTSLLPHNPLLQELLVSCTLIVLYFFLLQLNLSSMIIYIMADSWSCDQSAFSVHITVT